MRQALLAFHTEQDAAWRPSAPPDLSRYTTIDLDTETTGVSWQTGDRAVGLAVGAPEAGLTWYLPFAHRGGGNLDENVVKFWAQRELRGKRIRNLHTKFDLHMMRKLGADLRHQDCTFHDIAHSAALLADERQSFSLEALAQKELGLGKLDVGPKEAIADLPSGAVAAYAMRDVELVARLADAYAPRLQGESLTRVSQLEDSVIPAVVEIEANGMPIDVELLEHWLAESQRLIERLSYRLWQEVGFHVNPDSSKDLSRVFHQAQYAIPQTAAGHPSFTTSIMRAIEHEGIQLAWRIGKLRDLRSKYLEYYRAHHVNGVLYPTLNQLPTDQGGTISGRFSCVRPNLQQVMGQDKHDRLYKWLSEYGTEDYLIKRLFRPRDGVWVSADMRQVEYRLFVHFTKSPRLIQRYRDNPQTDFHAIVGDLIRPVRPDITRTEVKVFNFLTIFGGEYEAVAKNLGISNDKALALSRTYHEEFPEAHRLLSQAERIAEDRGYVKSILGRRSRFTDGRRLYKALNAVVQSSAADANKLVLADVYRERQRLGLTMRMTIHDSLEGDLADPATVGDYQAFLDAPRLDLSVPLLWSVKTGPTWANTH